MLLLPIILIHHLANSYWEYSNLSSRSCYLIFGVQVLTFRLGVGGHSFQFKCFRNPCCWCGWRWFYGSCCCYVWWVSWTVKVTFNTASHSFGNYGWEKYIAIKSVLSHVSFVFSSVSLCETWRLRCTGTCRENSLDRKVRTIRTSVPLLGLDEKQV